MIRFLTKLPLIFFIILFCGFSTENYADLKDNILASDNLIIDTHAHFAARKPNDKHEYEEIAAKCIEKMNSLGIKKTIIMPHPIGYGQKMTYTYKDFMDAVKKYPDRFAFMGGGGTLNILLNKDKNNKKISEKQLENFRTVALQIINDKAAGFGEISPEHFSLRKNHPYESFGPDHPYLLLLADISAEYGLPIEIHMEAIPSDMDAPVHLKDTSTPGRLKSNISAFEILLDHNPKAVIVWSHVGWDNSGYRTPELCSMLFDKHPNLYMNIKMGKDSIQDNSFFDRNKKIKKEWLDFFNSYQDRIMFASDQFYGLDEEVNPKRIEVSVELIKQLPDGIVNKITYENAQRIYKL